MIQKGAERLVLAATCLWIFAVMFDRLAALREGAAVAAAVGLLVWAATAPAGSAKAAGRQGGAVEGRWPQGWLLLPIGLWAAWTAASIAWSVSPDISTRAWVDEVVMALVGFLACYRIASTSRLPKRQAGQLKAAGKAAEDVEADRPRYALYIEASCWIGTLLLAISALTLRFHGIASPADIAATVTAPDRLAGWLAGCASFVGVVRQSSMLALIVLPIFLAMSARENSRHAGLSGIVLALLIGFASGSLLFWPLAAVVLAIGCWPMLRDKPTSAGAVVLGVAVALAFVVAAAIALAVTTYRDTHSAVPTSAQMTMSPGPSLREAPPGTGTLNESNASSAASASNESDSVSSWFKRATDLAQWSQRLQTIQDGDIRPQLWSFYLAHTGTHLWQGVGFGKPLPAIAYHRQAPSASLQSATATGSAGNSVNTLTAATEKGTGNETTSASGNPVEKAGFHVSHARALLLNTLLQVGVIGLFLQCLSWAVLIYAFIGRAPADPWLRAAGVALVLGMICRNLSDDLMSGSVVLAFWAQAGWLLGRARLSGIVRYRAASGRSIAMRRLRRVGN